MEERFRDWCERPLTPRRCVGVHIGDTLAADSRSGSEGRRRKTGGLECAADAFQNWIVTKISQGDTIRPCRLFDACRHPPCELLEFLRFAELREIGDVLLLLFLGPGEFVL